MPQFVWIAFKEMISSTIEYWKNSQTVVETISDAYMVQATKKKGRTTDYAPYMFWICYSIASFLYLLGWLAMAWLTIEIFRLLISVIF